MVLFISIFNSVDSLSTYSSLMSDAGNMFSRVQNITQLYIQLQTYEIPLSLYITKLEFFITILVPIVNSVIGGSNTLVALESVFFAFVIDLNYYYYYNLRYT